jgi:two-component system, chemotaxis family, chemotaxis protein CheY
MAMQNSRATAIGSSFPLDYSAISFLVVDDQPYTRRIVRSILTGFGSREVYESANGEEALELARNVEPSIIITDLVMPDSNGMNLIARLKAPESPVRNIPIIVLSGYLTKTAALSMISSGADEVLVKPVAPKALHEHITRIILRQDKKSAPAAFVQNRRRHSETGRKKSKELAYL